jgi:hypothetical protein
MKINQFECQWCKHQMDAPTHGRGFNCSKCGAYICFKLDEFWWDFTEDFDYEKVIYQVKLKDGAIVQCWPNAGFMNAVDGSGRVFKPMAGIKCRVDLEANL